MRNRRKPCNHSLHEVEVGKENTAPSTVAGLTDELATGCCSDFPLAVHHFQKQYVMGYTTLLFQGITNHSLFYAVYNPVVSEPYMPLPQLFCDTQPCRFRVLYTRHRHIQFPKGAGIISHMITSQQSIPASTMTMHLHRRKFRLYRPYSFSISRFQRTKWDILLSAAST